MKQASLNHKRQILVIGLAVITALTMAASMVSAQNIPDNRSSASSGASARSIVGAWRTVVTPRNCQTGQPLGSIQGLFTFDQGGTLSEYGVGPGSSPALVSPAYGVWQREHGWSDFSLVFIFYRYNASGAFVGSQKVTAALELGASGDDFTTISVIENFDANDQLLGSGCATAAGTRFK